MAEGWAHALFSGTVAPFSAGIETHGVNPAAVKVMAEAGVDISNQKSQNVTDFSQVAFDLVVTVCDHAHEKCPVLQGPVVHFNFPDSPVMAQKIAAQGGDKEAQLSCYRDLRDQIKTFVMTLPELLAKD